MCTNKTLESAQRGEIKKRAASRLLPIKLPTFVYSRIVFFYPTRQNIITQLAALLLNSSGHNARMVIQ